jgi:hypothetical protein
MDNYQTIQVLRSSFPLVCVVVGGLLWLVRPDSAAIVQTLFTMGGVAHQAADTKEKDIKPTGRSEM